MYASICLVKHCNTQRPTELPSHKFAAVHRSRTPRVHRRHRHFKNSIPHARCLTICPISASVHTVTTILFTSTEIALDKTPSAKSGFYSLGVRNDQSQCTLHSKQVVWLSKMAAYSLLRTFQSLQIHTFFSPKPPHSRLHYNFIRFYISWNVL